MSYPYPTPLHASICKKITELYGPYANQVLTDFHWTLRPSPQQYAVQVLVNGSNHVPAIWIFDNDPSDGVFKSVLTSEEEIDKAMLVLQAKIKASPRIHK